MRMEKIEKGFGSKKFIYSSMTDKFENLAGKKWNVGGHNDVSYLRKYPKVSLDEGTRNQLGADGFRLVRDWCEEHFGNDWIYEWNDFYFKHEKDAVFFALRWL